MSFAAPSISSIDAGFSGGYSADPGFGAPHWDVSPVGHIPHHITNQILAGQREPAHPKVQLGSLDLTKLASKEERENAKCQVCLTSVQEDIDEGELPEDSAMYVHKDSSNPDKWVHPIHKKCAKEWAKTGRTLGKNCPECRGEYDYSGVLSREEKLEMLMHRFNTVAKGARNGAAVASGAVLVLNAVSGGGRITENLGAMAALGAFLGGIISF